MNERGMTGGTIAARVAEVRARLGHVIDPELDEPVTELGFVTAITVGSGQSLSVSVTCDKPGQGRTSCTPAVLVSGLSRKVA